MLKKIRRNPAQGGLDVAPAMAVLMLVLVLPIDAISIADDSVRPSADLAIPLTADGQPGMFVNIVVTQREILVDGVALVDLERTIDESGVEKVQIPASARDGAVIGKIFAALAEKAATANPGSGRVLVQAERGVPLDLVGEVTYTAVQADAGEVRFVAIEGGP